MVRLLLERNADANTGPAEWNGRMVLETASEGGHLKARLLLERNADANAGPIKEDGRMALQAASGKAHVEVVRLLIERNADINAGPAGWDGGTALQVASERGHRGKRALQAVSEGGHLEVVRLLLEYHANAETMKLDIMQLRCRRLQKVAIWRWFGCCSNITLTSTLGDETALTAASESGHIDVACYCLNWMPTSTPSAIAERHCRWLQKAAI
jgi:ankyrin repeat protein